MTSIENSLETPPVLFSNNNPLESFKTYSPLTPVYSPESHVFEAGKDFYALTPCAPEKYNTTLQVPSTFGSPVSSPDNEATNPSGASPVLPAVDVKKEAPTGQERKVKRRRTRNKDVSGDADVKPSVRALQFPPCFVCGGKASGDHYGVNSCEACKGFFRRYLLREKGAYLCKKNGQCEVTHTIKGICAGCRLKKCLDLGMAKDKCKLGRYSSEKRTEKIRTAIELQAGQINQAPNNNMAAKDIPTQEDSYQSLESPCQDSAKQDEIISRILSQLNISEDRQKTFCDELVTDLVKAKNNMRPFDMDKCLTDEEIKIKIQEYHDHYMLKVKMYGEMKTVSKEEYTKLYGEFGIDIDDRMKELRRCAEDIEHEVNSYCNFAKRIPYFSKLSFKDQSNLLKVGRMDFYTTLMSNGYDKDLQILLHKHRPYHVSEMDKFFSQDVIEDTLYNYLKCQKLNLNERESCLLMALSLFFDDRCSLENRSLVEMIQLSLAQMLRYELERSCLKTSRLRFTKIIDYLTSLRDVSEKYFKEYEDLCRDEIYVNECPVLTDFLLET